jgi:hypothetical protein
MIIDSKQRTKKQQAILKDLSENQKRCDAIISFRINSVELRKLQVVAKENETTISKLIKTTLKHVI